MKIAIVAPSAVPFVVGGAERLWSGLLRAINEGIRHDAELLKLPTPEHSLPDVVDSYERWSKLDLSHFDMVISGKYPAWMVRHDNHVVYMLHTLRGLYDQYPVSLGRVLPDDPALGDLLAAVHVASRDGELTPVFEAFRQAAGVLGRDHPAFAFPGPLARALVHLFDRAALAPGRVRRYCAISRTVAGRSSYFPPGVRVEAVVPPSSLEGFACGRFDYFFTASRLDHPKRVGLLVEAMRHVAAPVPLWVAGTGPDLDRLRTSAAGDDRVQFLGHVGDPELLDLYANALAVPFVPMDEDLGLITLEAMASGKPVVTTDDSGGPTEFVVDGVNGLITNPTPEALGAALSRLAEDPETARRLGAVGARTAAAFTWERVTAALLRPDAPSEGRSVTRRRPTRPRLVATTTFPVHPRLGGGQLRCAYLFEALAERYDVELVSLAPADAPYVEVALSEGVVETSVPKSARHQAHEDRIAAAVGLPITDIVASEAIEMTPAYLDALASAVEGAAGVVLSHPFMLSAVDRVAPDLPIVYEAQDAEFHLKGSMLPESPLGAQLLDAVRRVERATVERAALVSACSSEDADALADTYAGDRSKFVVVSNGVDLRRVAFTPPDRRQESGARWLSALARAGAGPFRGAAVFTGSWHMPNIDAAKHVFELAAELPDVVFVLVGGHGDYFGRWFPTPPNVIRVGIISDERKNALLAAAHVALNPIVRGSGTNLKIVEYFASGVPVVSTPFGARGLDVMDGRELRLGPLEAFASLIVDVFGHPEEAVDRAARARALVERDFDWRVLGECFTERVVEALSRA